VLHLLSSGATAVPELDARVLTVVNELIADPSEHVSLRVLAERVRLSESRLAHLFCRDVGMPIRQYRLSLRMHEAITQMASGKSLTESAHTAGFAYSSHFCRICR
jgi:AraC-like DNA-binding protein